MGAEMRRDTGMTVNLVFSFCFFASYFVMMLKFG